MRTLSKNAAPSQSMVLNHLTSATTTTTSYSIIEVLRVEQSFTADFLASLSLGAASSCSVQDEQRGLCVGVLRVPKFVGHAITVTQKSEQEAMIMLRHL
eukprot:5076321-Amphidinium_carterae.1